MAVLRLCCHTRASIAGAFGILVPPPAMEPWSPALGAWSLIHQTTREVPVFGASRVIYLEVELLRPVVTVELHEAPLAIFWFVTFLEVTQRAPRVMWELPCLPQ